MRELQGGELVAQLSRVYQKTRQNDRLWAHVFNILISTVLQMKAPEYPCCSVASVSLLPHSHLSKRGTANNHDELTLTLMLRSQKQLAILDGPACPTSQAGFRRRLRSCERRLTALHVPNRLTLNYPFL